MALPDEIRESAILDWPFAHGSWSYPFASSHLLSARLSWHIDCYSQLVVFPSYCPRARFLLPPPSCTCIIPPPLPFTPGTVYVGCRDLGPYLGTNTSSPLSVAARPNVFSWDIISCSDPHGPLPLLYLSRLQTIRNTDSFPHMSRIEASLPFPLSGVVLNACRA